MAQIRISHEKLIGAPADVVYRVLSNYREHHPKVMPDSFVDFQVESGGQGAGTVMTFKTRTGGMTRSWRGIASEPEPGRRLVETYDNGTVTTFYVDPEDGGTHLRIETVWTPKGLQGVFERLLAPSLMKGVYAKELENIDAYAKGLSGRG